MHAESAFETLDARGKALVAKFLARTVRTNEETRAEAERRNLPLVSVDATASPEEIAERCLRAAAWPFRPN